MINFEKPQVSEARQDQKGAFSAASYSPSAGAVGN
jgi:hypothetical protein